MIRKYWLYYDYKKKKGKKKTGYYIKKKKETSEELITWSTDIKVPRIAKSFLSSTVTGWPTRVLKNE